MAVNEIKQNDYSRGEAIALAAPLLGFSAEQLAGLIIIGIPADLQANAMPLYFDTPDPQEVIAVLRHVAHLLGHG